MIVQSTLLSHPSIAAILAFATSHPLLAAIGLYAVIKFLICLYRISPVHPLAKIPGPTMAAATKWYRTWYEIWPHAGEMTKEIEKLHAKYGPIVRTGPNEVHCASPSAYLHIYSNASKAVKDPVNYKCLNADDSSVAFCDPALARERRDIINPFFARRNVIAMQYVIEDKLCLFTHLLRSIHNTDPDNVIDLALATKSFTNDVIMEFCFAKSLDTLYAPGFHHPIIEGTEKSLVGCWIFKHFPILKFILLETTPDKVVTWLMPEVAKGAILIKNVLGAQVDEFMKDPEGAAGRVLHEVIYNRLLGLGPDGKKDEKVKRPKIGRKSLYDEAVTLMFGGTDTVGNTVSVGTFHILRTPGAVDKLMEELKSVWPGNPWEGMPDVDEKYTDGSGRLPVGWEVLEKLPYLGAVIKESLRLSHGTVSGLPRLAPAQGMTVDGWKIPAGTSISSAAPFVHLNPEIFPEPAEFRPERWLGPDGAGLDKYLVAFSRGPRQCLGMNLAWCELYLTFATLYRRFEFELIDTKPEDLRWKDYNLPLIAGRIQVRVKPRLD